MSTESRPAAERLQAVKNRSASDFLADLRRLRAEAGAPSLRELGRIAARRRSEPLPPSTTSEVLAGKRLPRLPRLEFVESYVAACLAKAGLTEPGIVEGTAHWLQAWRSVVEAEPPGAVSPPPVPVGRKRRGWVLAATAFLAGAVLGSAGTRWYGIDHPPVARAAAAGPEDACEAPGPPEAGHDVLAGTRPWWINNDQVRLDTGDVAFEATVRPGTSRPGDLLVVKSAVPVVAGRRYTLTFTARADRPARFRVRVQDNQSPLYTASFERELPVDTRACPRRYHFTGGKTSSHSELTFQVGGQPDEFRLSVSAVTLVETS